LAALSHKFDCRSNRHNRLKQKAETTLLLQWSMDSTLLPTFYA